MAVTKTGAEKISPAVENNLLHAIQKDDIGEFNALMEEVQCGELRLGRFPVLSLLYLYNSRKILSSYEEEFLKISKWHELRESPSAAVTFSKKAGKCLRLYLSEVVSPLEMLLILNKTKKLKRIFPFASAPEGVKARLQSIYSIRYSLGIRYEGTEIIIDRRPLSYAEKKKILIACLACFLAVAIAIVAPVTSVKLLGKRSGGNVTRLSHIDFGANTTYTLKKDIEIPKNFSVKKVRCTIIGEGHKLTFGKNATLGELSGKLRDLKIQTSGSPIFTVCTREAVISDVSVEVNADVNTSKTSAFIAVTNCGAIENVNMSVGGKMYAPTVVSDDELIFGGIAAYNSYTYIGWQIIYGAITNCTVNYSNFSISGETAANASFGGIVGVNYGGVIDCSVSGEITADTFDLAGICYVNANTLSGLVNEADLFQTSQNDFWTPIVAGIAIENASLVEYCKNTGNLTTVGSDEAICGGIVGRTYGQTSYCISEGDISVSAYSASVGGIFGSGVIAMGDGYVHFGHTNYCLSKTTIHATLNKRASGVGGIGGTIEEKGVERYVYDDYGRPKTDGNGNYITETVYLGGRITNCIAIGAVEGSFNYYGEIVGVCGANIYEINSYTVDKVDYPIFYNNYYANNTLKSFGATKYKETETSDVQYFVVDGKEATFVPLSEMQDNETYKNILKAFEK